MEERVDVEAKQIIYKAARTIKRRENSLYNALRSIYEDSIFVNEISQLWPSLPLLANLRCGLWYSPHFHSTCYFNSTDGHTNHLSFRTFNLLVALLAGNHKALHLLKCFKFPLEVDILLVCLFGGLGQKGGRIIVDSTRKGKRFPDTIQIFRQV